MDLNFGNKQINKNKKTSFRYFLLSSFRHSQMILYFLRKSIFFQESITIQSIAKPFPHHVSIYVNILLFNPQQLETYLVQMWFPYLKQIFLISTVFPVNFEMYSIISRLRNNNLKNLLWKVTSLFIFFLEKFHFSSFDYKIWNCLLVLPNCKLVYLEVG